LDSSSTSSSRSSWQALALGLLLALLYEGALRTGRVLPGHGVGQNQKNVVQSEAFVFGGETRSGTVVVGSSLAANLMDGFLSVRPAENLALGGESSLTGLALVADAPSGQRKVVIELSHALNVVKDPKLTALTEAPITAIATRNCWSLRQEFQPANVLSRYLARSSASRRDEPGPAPLAESVRGPIIADVMKLFSAPPTDDESRAYQANLTALRAELDGCAAKGLECVLFWPPIDAAINDSPRERTFYRMARGEFPTSRYHWLDSVSTSAARTNDGYHLIPADARAYGRALAEAVGP